MYEFFFFWGNNYKSSETNIVGGFKVHAMIYLFFVIFVFISTQRERVPDSQFVSHSSNKIGH